MEPSLVTWKHHCQFRRDTRIHRYKNREAVPVENRSIRIIYLNSISIPISMPTCFFLKVAQCKTVTSMHASHAYSCIYAAENMDHEEVSPKCSLVSQKKMTTLVLVMSVKCSRKGEHTINMLKYLSTQHGLKIPGMACIRYSTHKCHCVYYSVLHCAQTQR